MNTHTICKSLFYTYSKWGSPKTSRTPLNPLLAYRLERVYMFSKRSSLKLISSSGTLLRIVDYRAPKNLSLFKGSGIVCGVILGLNSESKTNNHLLSFIPDLWPEVLCIINALYFGKLAALNAGASACARCSRVNFFFNLNYYNVVQRRLEGFRENRPKSAIAPYINSCTAKTDL